MWLTTIINQILFWKPRPLCKHFVWAFLPDEHVNKNWLNLMIHPSHLVHLHIFFSWFVLFRWHFRPKKHVGNLRKWLVRLGCKQDGRCSLMGEGCTRNHLFKNQLHPPLRTVKFILMTHGSVSQVVRRRETQLHCFQVLLMVQAFSIR